MLEFKKIEINDIDIYKKFMQDNKAFSCENSFVNLLLWGSLYNNMMAVDDGHLFIKSGKGEHESFRLPLGENLNAGLEKIFEYNNKKPDFWIQDGGRLSELSETFKNEYCLYEKRDAFDYIYLRENLATLSGKKYHSKRNHISAFSKKFQWHYESITENNIEKVRECAEKWYSEREMDKYLLCEKNGIELILSNMPRLCVKGGAIFIDNKVVAFTLGSALNKDVFDIHIEKALKDYAEGYTVINREFAKYELQDYKYINREDDLGLEGLRKAKLSYKPEILLKKYHAVPKVKI